MKYAEYDLKSQRYDIYVLSSNEDNNKQKLSS